MFNVPVPPSRTQRFDLFAELDVLDKWPFEPLAQYAEEAGMSLEDAQRMADREHTEIADQLLWLESYRELIERSAPPWASTVDNVDPERGTFVYIGPGDLVDVALLCTIVHDPHVRVAVDAQGPALAVRYDGIATVEAVEKLIEQLQDLDAGLRAQSRALRRPASVDEALDNMDGAL